MLAMIVAATMAPSAGAQGVETPNFSDQRQRPALPDLPGLSRVRFLTSVDYPPFNFLDARGRLAGFNVELARAICEELAITDICQIEARAFDELVPALQAGEGDAIIAGLAVTAENRQALAFTESYFRYPARFVALADADLAAALSEGLNGRRIGVVEGTAHAAMLAAFFPAATAVAHQTRDAMLTALRAGEVEAAFGDGVGLSFWLASESAESCCAFVGGAYLSDRFLGEGLAIAVRPEQAALADAFDEAIVRIVERRRFSELLLRYFPISAF